MTILTPAQLQTIRTQPQSTTLYLSVYRPKVLMEAQLTGSYSFGARTLSYNNVITGSYLNVYANSTMLIGTTPEDDDIGRVRVRSITSSTVSIAENDFTFISGTYLTFLNYVDLVAVYPRIIQDPSNAENVIFYKDYDIPYSNQNTVYGSFPCAGPHRATFVSSTGTVYYTATGSYNVLGNPMTYQWEFEGGTPTGSSSFEPGYVTYTTPGHYKTKLTVFASGTAGNTQDVTYRYVSVYDKPGAGNNPPILKWELTDFSGDRNSGGYSIGLKVFDNLGDIEPNALVVLFSEDVYGVDTVSLGGNAKNASNIVFVGYVIGDTIKFNYKESYVEFKCGNVTEVMKQAEGFSVSCESKVTPTTWFELSNMTIQKALYHYLRWHSTVLNVADFQYTGDDRFVQYFDADRGSLYDAVNSFIDTGVIGETVSDRQGKIWAEITPAGYENPFSSLPFNFTLQKQDWMEEPNITEKRTSETSVVEMGGILYNGAVLNTYQAYLTTAPSLTPYYRGKVQSPREGLILNSQEQLNQIAGNWVAIQNAQFEDVTVTLNGDYRNIDIAPQEQFSFDIDSNDMLMPENLIGWKFRPISMNWQYNPVKGSFYPQASYQPILTGTPGQTLLIPATPPEIGYSYPSLNLPPIPYFSPGTVAVNQQVGTTVLMVDSALGFVYTNDFDSDQPTWIAWNTGLDPEYQTSTLRQFFIAPNGAVWCLLTGRNTKTYIYDRVYRAPNVGGIFQLIVDFAFLQAQYPGFNSDNYRVSAIGFNQDAEEEVGIIMGAHRGDTLQTSVNLWKAQYPTLTKGTANVVTTLRNGSLTFDGKNKKWLLMDDRVEAIPGFTYSIYRINNNGSSVENISATVPTLGNVYIITARDTGRTYMWATTTTQLWVTANDGTDIDTIGDNQQNGSSRWSYACDPTGQFLLGNWTAANKGQSGDYGYTWVGTPTLPPGGAYVFCYAGGEGTSTGWIAARGVVRYSPNFGNTWINKEGNLLQIAPIPDIYGIAVQPGSRDI